jgi:hypothetical protein
MRILAAVVLTLVLAAPSQTSNLNRPDTSFPNINSVSGFMEICSSVDKPSAEWKGTDALNFGYCMGWITGFVYGIPQAETYHKIPVESGVICFPEGINYVQMIHVVKKGIADHPEGEHLGTPAIALFALRTAFPCGK